MTILRACVLLGSGALAACGGGGGGGGNPGGTTGGSNPPNTTVVTDTTAPLLLTTFPLSGARDVASGSTVMATFSEAVDESTITATSFTVQGITGKVTLSGDYTTATFTPDAPLQPGTLYTAALTTGIRDTAGNALASGASWSFTTAAAADTTAPSVQNVTPVNGSTANPATSIISATFTEPLDCTSVSASTVHLFEGTTAVNADVTCTGATITLLPPAGTPANTTLTVSIDVAVADLAGNGLANPYGWSFDVAPWTRQLGTSNNDYGFALASDASGNVYVAGYTEGALDGQTSAGMSDAYVTKYDKNGRKQWTRQSGTVGNDVATAVTVDLSGNVFVTGYTNGGGLDGQAYVGGEDVFVIKYDGAGNKQWTRQLGTTIDDMAMGLTTDGSGNVYVAGYTWGNLDGQAHSNSTSSDIFITKYDGNGNRQWTRETGTCNPDSAFAVTSDPSGNIYVTGQLLGLFDNQMPLGLADVFLIKYDESGNKQWSRLLGTATGDVGQAVRSDAAGNIYVAGYTSGALDAQASAGGDDLFISKYDTNGNRIWTRQAGSAASDYATALSFDGSGNLYVAGYTDGALDIQANAGSWDSFIAKYDGTGQVQWTHQFGTASADVAYGITADPFGNVYVAGYTGGGLDGQGSTGGDDLFVVRYQSDGSKR